MKRTTLPLAPSLLKAIREIAREEGIAMRKAISDLLELGLKARAKQGRSSPPKPFRWHTQPMNAKVDYDDKEKLIEILDSRK